MSGQCGRVAPRLRVAEPLGHSTPSSSCPVRSFLAINVRMRDSEELSFEPMREIDAAEGDVRYEQAES